MNDYKTYRELIDNVVYLIINKEDFNEAAKILIYYNISISKLLRLTYKISCLNIAKLTDEIIKINRGM